MGNTKKQASKKAKPEKAISHEGKILVTRTVVDNLGKGQKQTEKVERISIRPFATNPAHVSVKKGITANLENYESCRIDVMITVPCYIEEIRDVFEQTNALVEELVGDEARRIEEARSEGD